MGAPLTKRSNAELYFESLMGTLAKDLKGYVIEFKFHKERKWRFDFAWVEEKIAVEIEGGVYTNGRHTRGSGYEKDIEKYNEAVILGWRVIRFTPTMLRNDPIGCLNLIRKLLGYL